MVEGDRALQYWEMEEMMVLGIYGSGGLGRGIQEYVAEIEEWKEIVFIDDTVEEISH